MVKRRGMCLLVAYSSTRLCCLLRRLVALDDIEAHAIPDGKTYNVMCNDKGLLLQPRATRFHRNCASCNIIEVIWQTLNLHYDANTELTFNVIWNQTLKDLLVQKNLQ